MTKTLLLMALIPFGLALGGCADTTIPVAQMSCTDLAKEIGRNEQLRQDGDIDAVVGTLGSVVSDDKDDRLMHGITGMMGDIQGSVARDRLSELQSAFDRRQCQ